MELLLIVLHGRVQHGSRSFLLVAGRGTRISRMVQKIPKSTLPVNGVPLLRLMVELLQRKGMEIVVCVGYRQNMIRDALKQIRERL